MNPTIGKNVVIDTGAIVFWNITIDDNTIVAAGSVVLDSVSDRVMVAGNPAVVKKHYT